MNEAVVDPEPAMTCARVIREELAEQYVAGRLGDEIAASFEAHYFSCDRCFTDVETWRAMGAALASAHAVDRNPAQGRWWLWTAAAAAVLLAAVAMFRYWPPRGQPAQSSAGSAPAPSSLVSPVPSGAPPAPAITLASLSAIVPPPYAPMRVRGATDEATRRFGAAMTRYQAGDFAGAIPDLEAAATLDPKLSGAPFFLGVCWLMIDDAPHAIDRFREVTALGESAYLEEAQYFLAKALLRKGDVTAARAALTKTVGLNGDRATEARQLLADLDALGRGKGVGR